MKIILKHILKNIWEKKGRSLLIILSLIIATTVFVLNLTLPNEIMLKIEETLRSVFGNSDVSIMAEDSFSINDVNLGNEEIEYIGISEIEIEIADNQAILFGVDVSKTKEMKMLGSDVPSLNKNEIIIGTKQAEEYHYNEGDVITFFIENEEYELQIAKIVDESGLTALETEVPLFIATSETINEIRNTENDKFDVLYIDVKNDDNAKSFTEYLQDNNENYGVESLANIELIKEEMSFISYIMILILVMATIMIFFVVSSLNKIIIAERMPVIGTFRSIGATKGKMNLILILENVVYGLIGGSIGCLIGYKINSSAASLFVSSDGIGLTNKTSQMSLSVILLGIIFAVLLEFFISIRSILKANKKSIKDIIFDVQSSRFIIRRISIILGISILVLSLIINYFNTSMNIVLTIISLIFLIVGIATLVPVIMRIMSMILSIIFKKIGWATGIIASKNIGYNKMIISSSRLIVVALSLMIAILTASNSFTSLFNSFRYIIDDCDIIVTYPNKTSAEYDELLNMDEIIDIKYMYYFSDIDTTYNDGKKFDTTPILIGQDKTRKYIKELDYKIEDLKYNEVLIDEKVAENNNIKINDILKIKFGTLNKEIEFKVVGLVNSAYFTTSRNVIVMNFQNYIENITDIPMQINLELENGINHDEMKDKISEKINELDVEIQTFDEYVTEQEESTSSIMSLFYIIIGLAVILSFIGIVNNQVISFMQRKKEIAILNSTCMSKKQIIKMLRVETILANAISCILAVLVGIISLGIIDSFMQGLRLYVEMIFDWNLILKFVVIIFIVLLLTLRIPSKRLKKMNIVNEIKYE